MNSSLILTLIDFVTKVRIINHSLAQSLNFSVLRTNIYFQKIYSTILQTFEMIIWLFEIEHKVERF